MKRKKSRHQRAWPTRMCCLRQKPKHKQCVRHMNQGVNQQVATRIQVEEVAIDHMGDPGKRMPVSLVKSRECPSESRKRNAAIHHWIILDVHTIIESDEFVPNHLRINPKGHYRQP